MQGKLRQTLNTPTFADNYQMQLASFINVILLTLMAGTLLLLTILIIMNREINQLALLYITIISTIILKVLLNLRYLRTVAVLLVSLTWFTVTMGAINHIGVYAPINSAYTIFIILSGIFFRQSASLYALFICMITSFLLAYGNGNGMLATPQHAIPPYIVWLTYTLIYSAVAALVYVAARLVRQSLRTSEAVARQLQVSSDNLRRAETLAHIGNFELDPHTEKIIWSDEVYRIFDVPIGTPITLNDYQSQLVGDSQDSITRYISSAVATGQAYEVERPIISGDGIRKDVFIIGNPVKDASGRVTKIFGVVQDITARKRAEVVQDVLLNISRTRFEDENLHALLQYTFEQLSKLLNVSNCYVALYDIETEVYSFPYGYDQYDKDWSPQKLEKSLTDYVRRTGKAQIVTEDDYKRLEKDANIEFFGELSKVWLGAPLKIQQRVIGVIAIQDYQNITAFEQSDLDLLAYVAENIASVIESKRAENERLELQIQKEKNDFLQEFISHMTHDLKTPLSVIKNSSDLLKMVKDPLRRVEYIERINYQLDRLDRMIDDILTISRLDHAQASTRALLNLNLLLKHISNQLQPKIQQKQIKLVLDLKPDLPLVFGIESDLIRALLNLLENATHYTEDHGQIRIYTYQADDMVVCEIHDTGIGIHPDDLDNIFERFFRADNARNFERGTGLGLSIVHRIIELHNGTIEVNSQLGIGTTFTIRLAKFTEIQTSTI